MVFYFKTDFSSNFSANCTNDLLFFREKLKLREIMCSRRTILLGKKQINKKKKPHRNTK